ncbi:MAG: PEP-CTERM sorting domain-containing protein [Burkholderiales bacterium]|nr:PEP-CTERM sorting domain-containing protein [Burkholderiales bacterium]
MTGHVIRINNEGGPGPDTTDIRIAFGFSFSWDVDLSADDPMRDFASAGAFFALSGFEAGIDAIDIDGDGLGPLTDPFMSSAYIFNPTYTTLGGGTGGSGTITIGGFIIVRAESIGEFSVITDATGRAFHIPEPGSMLLVGLALAGLAATRRRKVA